MSGQARKTNSGTKKWDTIAAEGLKEGEEAAYYLEEAFKDGPEMFLFALNRIVSARGGVTKLAKKSGLSRESLYKLLSGERGARLSSVSAILSALEIRVAFSFDAAKPKTKRRLVGSRAA